MRCGFVGLGQLGAPMAANLAAAHDVKVFDFNPEVIASVVAAGASEASSTKDFADVDVLILCLPSGVVVENALLDEELGIAESLAANTVVIDTSTIEYSLTLSISERLHELGLRFLDAPVSGKKKQAQQGTLTMKIGGDADLVEDMRPVLATMASRILLTGAVGCGQLTSARDNARAREQAKANLLTVMSHEMRTPLSGILGSMELLETTGTTPEQDSYLRAMRVSGELLLHYVNEVLQLSHIEAGAASEQPCTVDLKELMTGLVDSQQATALARNNRLELRWRLNGPTTVQGRPQQIQQIMLNLIGNALKFTKNGTVSVTVERQPNDGQVEFVISDTGVGVAKEDLERIFEEFVTLDTRYGRTSEGTGLGLAITRRIVAKLGGVIEAESEPGVGSLFRVALPLPVGTESQIKAPRQFAGTMTPKHLLVVEDSDMNRELLAKTLRGLGHQVMAAASGVEAVDAAAECHFDLILMDISMPQVDGLEAYRRIRDQKLAEGVDIVALTAHAAEEDHARILEAGFAEVATKPISRLELSQLVSRRTRVRTHPEIMLESSNFTNLASASTWGT